MRRDDDTPPRPGDPPPPPPPGGGGDDRTLFMPPADDTPSSPPPLPPRGAGPEDDDRTVLMPEPGVHSRQGFGHDPAYVPPREPTRAPAAEAEDGAPPAKRGRKRKPKRPLPVRLVSGLIRLGLVLLALWALTIAAIHLWGRRDEARPADAIVVLGAAHYDGRPSPVLKARLDHAIDLHRRDLAPVLIMTGGTAPGDTVSEAVAARRYAIRQGVDEDAILTEETGLTTLQSMKAVRRVMDQRGLRRAVLVSDPFHMLRLKLLSLRVGIEGFTSPTPTSPISRNRSEERKFLIRESFSLPFALIEP